MRDVPARRTLRLKYAQNVRGKFNWTKSMIGALMFCACCMLRLYGTDQDSPYTFLSVNSASPSQQHHLNACFANIDLQFIQDLAVIEDERAKQVLACTGLMD